jgi:hypothetical protein
MSYFDKWGDDMASFELPKEVPDRRLRPEEFKSEAFRRDAFERDQAVEDLGGGRNVNLQRLAEALAPEPLEKIAAMIRGLTYGDMMALAEALWEAKVEPTDISKDALPSVLHRWSTSRPV